jgi:2-amino-4-hydroxy-6-hydroxymethyldihydropteridine diphosphokinase
MRDVAYIALGSNLGDRDGFLRRARAALGQLPGSRIMAESAVEETPPFGPPGQPPYLNQMVALETTLDPEALMAELLRIEQAEGRVRGVKWGPRTLDLDIVMFDQQSHTSVAVTVPHPGLPERDFWQRQLKQVRRGSPSERDSVR